MRQIMLCSTVVMLLTAWSGTGLWAMETADCLGCHNYADEVGEMNHVDETKFMATAHAAMGCEACHAVSEEHPFDAETAAVVSSCEDCHVSIHETYSSSVHGDNAACVDCHNPHQAYAPVSLSGRQMNDSCDMCHPVAQMEKVHSRWLPETGIHLDAVPCVTCHSSSDDFSITLYLRHRDRPYTDYELASYTALQEQTGSENIAVIIDTDASGEISLEELNAFYENTESHGMRLWAMMTPETVEHNFTTFDNRWDCTYCHAAGPENMQESYVALPKEDGTYRRLPLEKGATLDALFGTPDFYMVGATRSRTLDIIGLLIILGGFAMPVGHGTIRFLTRKNRRKDH
jgi:predicted CXXCH cytochrome family protein